MSKLPAIDVLLRKLPKRFRVYCEVLAEGGPTEARARSGLSKLAVELELKRTDFNACHNAALAAWVKSALLDHVEGVKTAKYHNGEVVGWERERSESITLAVAQALLPEYAARSRVEHQHMGSIRIEERYNARDAVADKRTDAILADAMKLLEHDRATAVDAEFTEQPEPEPAVTFEDL